MKKFLTLLAILLLFTSLCFAYDYPRWKSMPIKVYIPEYGDYSKLMKRAFDTWQAKSNNIVRFKYVNNINQADIYVGFVDRVSACNDSNAVGCTAYGYIIKGYFQQNYIEIGTKDVQLLREGGKLIKKEVPRSPEHIYGVMLHEAGHAIGLKHSEDKNSIMYHVDLDDMQELTDVDLQLLRDKYN